MLDVEEELCRGNNIGQVFVVAAFLPSSSKKNGHPGLLLPQSLLHFERQNTRCKNIISPLEGGRLVSSQSVGGRK